MSWFFRAFRGLVPPAPGAHTAAGVGRVEQGDGRHTLEYVERHGQRARQMIALGQRPDGMHAVGAAGRQSLDDLFGGEQDRGDRHGADQQRFGPRVAAHARG